MSGVICIKGWEEKKIAELVKWAEKNRDRYVVVFEESNIARKSPFPQVESVPLVTDDLEGVFRSLVWKYLFLPFFYECKKGEEQFFFVLQHIHTEIQAQVCDFADNGIGLLKNIQSNLSTPFQKVEDLFGKFSETPAVVCGAGPSFLQNSKQITSLFPGALVIAGGRAVEILAKEKAPCHFAVHVDPRCRHTFTPNTYPTVYQLRTDPAVLLQHKGRKLLLAGNGNFPLEKRCEEASGLSSLSFDGGFTVGTHAAALAFHLGCNPIILVGMDFSTLIEPKASDMMHFTIVQGDNKEKIYVRKDWLLAREWLSRFAEERKETSWFQGVVHPTNFLFPSIPYKPLEEIAASFSKTSEQIEKKVKTELEAHLPQDPPPIWQEIEASCRTCFEIAQKTLARIETIYPNSPLEDGESRLLEHEFSEQLVAELAVDPIWKIWKHVFSRHNPDGERGLFLHKIIFSLQFFSRLFSHGS